MLVDEERSIPLRKASGWTGSQCLSDLYGKPASCASRFPHEMSPSFPPPDLFAMHTQRTTEQIQEPDNTATDVTETDLQSPERILGSFFRERKKRRPGTSSKKARRTKLRMPVRPKDCVRVTHPKIVQADPPSHSCSDLAGKTPSAEQSQQAEKVVAPAVSARLMSNTRAACVDTLLESFVANEIDGVSQAALSAMSEQIAQVQVSLYGVMQSFLLEEAGWLAVEEAASSCAACFEEYGLLGDPKDAAALAAAQLIQLTEGGDSSVSEDELSPHLHAVYILCDLK